MDEVSPYQSKTGEIKIMQRTSAQSASFTPSPGINKVVLKIKIVAKQEKMLSRKSGRKKTNLVKNKNL